MEFLLKMPKKRKHTLIQILPLAQKLQYSSLLFDGTGEFSVEIGPILAAAGIVGLAFGFGGQYLIRDIISGLLLFLKINTAW
jgi:small conductance mechanosensitive channel